MELSSFILTFSHWTLILGFDDPQLRAIDKYKFVLNHKIQLLENEIEPKDNKIGEILYFVFCISFFCILYFVYLPGEMKQQILAMEEELTAVVKDQVGENTRSQKTHHHDHDHHHYDHHHYDHHHHDHHHNDHHYHEITSAPPSPSP